MELPTLLDCCKIALDSVQTSNQTETASIAPSNIPCIGTSIIAGSCAMLVESIDRGTAAPHAEGSATNLAQASLLKRGFANKK